MEFIIIKLLLPVFSLPRQLPVNYYFPKTTMHLPTRYNSVEARWCSSKRIRLSIRGSVVHGQVGLFIALLFPKTRNFAPHCLSSPRRINGYWRHAAGCNPAMAKHLIQGGGGGVAILLVAALKKISMFHS